MSDVGDFTARACLSPEPTAPARARAFARDALRAWGMPDDLVDDAVLLVSELVANAVQHAGTELEVRFQLSAEASPELEVQVIDRHPARALPHEPALPSDVNSERGRGLLLPSAIASVWGVTYAGAAKKVWFRLPLGVGGDPSEAAGCDDPAAPADRSAGELPRRELGNLGFEELLRRTVESARDAVGADGAYALVADEEGELRVRGAVGIASPELLTVPPGTVVLSGGGAALSQLALSQLSVPFLVDGRVTGVLGVGSSHDGAFSGEDSWRLQKVADRVAMSLERLRLSELERVRRGRVAFLAEASELLSTTLDQRQAVALTAQLMVPRLAAWCAVYLAHFAVGSAADPRATQAGELRPAYVWHEDESRIDDLSRLLDEIAPPGLPGFPGTPRPNAPGFSLTSRHGLSWSLAVPSGAGPEMMRMASDSAWCFPLTARGRGLGIVVIGRPRGDRRWPGPPPRESLELAEDLTRRAALALDNARLYERQRTTSQALQHSLLPPELPSIPGVELAAEYEAAGEANEVGGDFYDVFPVEAAPGSTAPAGTVPAPTGTVRAARWRFAIGDVCGMGPEAAAVTGLARNTLRILASEGHPITEVVR